MNSGNGKTTQSRGYAPVNGLKMYYEVEGTGDPLVCIPPAFGYAGLNRYPALLQSHTVITVDLQGHGRTADIPDRPLSIEQYAKDVVGLLKCLGIPKADFFGESYGGNAAAMIAIRYPDLVRRVAAYAATFGPPQVALNPRTIHSTGEAPPHPPTVVPHPFGHTKPFGFTAYARNYRESINSETAAPLKPRRRPLPARSPTGL